AIVGPSPLRNTKRSSAPVARSPSMSVGNQGARCSGSVSARHTFSGGWGSLRVKWSCHRSPTGSRRPCTAIISFAVVQVVHGLEMSLEIIEARRPQKPVRLQPLVDGAQRLRADAVEA